MVPAALAGPFSNIALGKSAVHCIAQERISCLALAYGMNSTKCMKVYELKARESAGGKATNL